MNIDKEVSINILWPREQQIQENVLNNNSIVAKLQYEGVSLLFTGDIEEIAEKQILYEYRNNLRILSADILKVGHHGSKTSSIMQFVKVVQPKIALIGAGKDNTFGHPSNDVIKRLNAIRYKNI